MKVFSLEEANGSLPAVKDAFGRIFALNGMIRSNASDANALVDLWGEEIHQRGHTDNEYYLRLAGRHDEFVKGLQREVRSVQRLGCFVKDIENGLVDFYYDLKGELVFLCWKYGEEKIRYWHSASSGFSGRMPITDLLAVQRR